jgi:DNA-binding transcriptional MocR family regulator
VVKLPADPRGLTLGASASWVRRNVGPVAWVVLEALAEHAIVDGTTTMSYRSVRDIAADLHLANDTVASALRRLAGHGLAQHRSDRSTTGRFATGHYLLTLPPHVLTPTTSHSPTSPPNRPKPPANPTTKRRPQTTEHQQLDLLHQPTNGPHP